MPKLLDIISIVKLRHSKLILPKTRINTNIYWPHTFVSPSADSRETVVSYWRKYVHEVLVNRLGSLSLPRKSVVRLYDRPDMTLDVYRGRKTTTQQQQQQIIRSPCDVINKSGVYYLWEAGVLCKWMLEIYQKISEPTQVNSFFSFCLNLQSVLEFAQQYQWSNIC